MLAAHTKWFSNTHDNPLDWIPDSWAAWDKLREHECAHFDGYHSSDDEGDDEGDDGGDDEEGHAIDVYDGTRRPPTDEDDEEEEYMGATFEECTSKD
jgi:hypothetical protein